MIKLCFLPSLSLAKIVKKIHKRKKKIKFDIKKKEQK